MPGINDINLIPSEIIADQMNRHRIRKWSIFIICQIICFFLLGISFYGYLTRLENRAAAIRSRNGELNQVGTKLISTYQDIEDVLKKKEALLHLVQKQCFSPVLVNLAQDMDPKTRLIQLGIERETIARCNGVVVAGLQGSKIEGFKGKRAYYDLTLGGMSQSYQSLSTFLLHLQQDKDFQEIRLIKSDMTDMGEKEHSFINFEISLIYRGS